MRRRATFITDQGQEFDPADIKVQGRRLQYSGIKAAREERLTFSLDELPADITKVLQQSHELHIRWTGESAYETTPPYVSRLTSGLHVHHTPLKEGKEENNTLCTLLRSIFFDGLECDPVQSTFIRPSLVSERFSSSTALQYYALVAKLDALVDYIKRSICAESDFSCHQTASQLLAADYFDIDYDSISHAMVMTAFWSSPDRAYQYQPARLIPINRWALDITSKLNDKVELGFLSRSKAVDPHEMQMQGMLMVVGEDDQPKPTMFSFPSRHHLLPPSQSPSQQYNVSFVQPAGLHPILQIQFSSAPGLQPPSTKPEDSTCALHAYFTLPSSLFADQYAFPTTTADPLFEAAHHIKLLRSISGELDLEAPDYVIERWGSTMLLELSTPSTSSSSSSSATSNPKTQSSTDDWTVTIPLHLRYHPPSTTQSHHKIDMPWPNVFWACTAEDGTKFPVNPFDRIHLGYDSLFGPRTMFYHLPQPVAPSSSNTASTGRDTRLVETISVPVLDASKVGGDHVVQWGTLVVVLAGFAWIMRHLLPAMAGGPEKRDTHVKRSKSTWTAGDKSSLDQVVRPVDRIGEAAKARVKRQE